MADWYIMGRYDQTRLGRILDISQDLKAIDDLLHNDILPFLVDLACAAARRQFIKLDKWMQDKMTEHGVKFVITCLKFLERRCPTLVYGKYFLIDYLLHAKTNLCCEIHTTLSRKKIYKLNVFVGDPLRDEQTLPRSAQLPSDTINTILNHLKDALTHLTISFDTITIIMKYVKNAPAVAKRPNPPPNQITKQLIPSPPPSINPLAPVAPHLDQLRPLGDVSALPPSPFSPGPGPVGPPSLMRQTSFGPIGSIPSPFSPPPPVPDSISLTSPLFASKPSAFTQPVSSIGLDRASNMPGTLRL